MAAGKQHKPLTVRGQFWQRHLQRWSQSGLSQAQYCRQQRLSAAAFGWWKGRLSAGGSKRVTPKSVREETGDKNSPFVELTLSDAGRTGSGSKGFPYEIVVGPQRCLRLGYHYELEQVRQLLVLLESQC